MEKNIELTGPLSDLWDPGVPHMVPGHQGWWHVAFDTSAFRPAVGIGEVWHPVRSSGY